MSNYTLPNYEQGRPRAFPINYNGYCPDNNIIFDIPKRDANGKCVEWKKVLQAPTTVKHLYSEQPLNYEPIFTDTPQQTLYGHEFLKTYSTGMGRSKVIGGGHYITWPVNNVHVKENRDYTNYYFERPEGYGYEKNGVGAFTYTSLTDAKLSNWF
jgi:hypothetical protein